MEDDFRISTFVPEVAPSGFTFNQFLVRAEEPLLLHTGPRAVFPLASGAVQTLVPVESVRWVTFGHVESDECGSMNLWLDAPPWSQVAHGELGCMVSLFDLCARAPRPLADGEVIDLGGKRVRQIPTPHVPRLGSSGVVRGDDGHAALRRPAQPTRSGPAVTTDDVFEAAMAAEETFHQMSLAPSTSSTLRALGDLEPSTLAIMHGSSFRGDGRKVLYEVASRYEALMALPA